MLQVLPRAVRLRAVALSFAAGLVLAAGSPAPSVAATGADDAASRPVTAHSDAASAMAPGVVRSVAAPSGAAAAEAMLDGLLTAMAPVDDVAVSATAVQSRTADLSLPLALALFGAAIGMLVVSARLPTPMLR